MKEMWDKRFAEEQFVYGTNPNAFIRNEMDKLSPGVALFAAEGEGRNAIYAAKKGWTCDCYDFSSSARDKALRLATNQRVEINYHVTDLATAHLFPDYYDAVFVSFLHVLPEIRKKIHHNLLSAIKPGGILVMESFHTNQIEHKSGGPKNPLMLYNEEIAKEDFNGLDIIHCEAGITTLDEGPLHQGKGHTLRFIAQKPE